MENLNSYNNKEFYKKLAIVALPIALQSLISCSLNLLDNLMVGALGETELAAVGVALQIYFINWMVMYGFTSGTATFMAQFYGSGEIGKIRKTIGFAMTICLGISMLFFMAAVLFPQSIVRIFTDIPEIIDMSADYVRLGAPTFLLIGITVPFTAALRATQQTKLPLMITTAAFILNTVLNFFLIFGNLGAPKMGILGAALATDCARLLEMTLMIYVVFGRKNMLAAPVREFFGWNKEFAGRIVRNAVPTTLNETMWGLGTTMYVAAYARIGITEYAAVQAATAIDSLFIMAAFSLGDAALILVGQKLGERRLDEAYTMSKEILKISVIVGIAGGALLILLARPIISLFSFTAEAQHYTFLILVVFGIFMVFHLYNGIMITGLLRSGGDTKFAMISEVCCVWLIGVPAAFISTMVFHLPVYWAVVFVRMEDVVKFFILTKRFLSKKWVKNVISEMET